MKKLLLLSLSLMLGLSIKAQIAFTQDTLSSYMYANTTYPTTNTVHFADIDGDGIKDAVASSTGLNNVVGKYGVIVYFKNDGNANFQTADTLVKYYRFGSLQVCDLNNDGSNDLVFVYNWNPQQVIWYANDGNGNFTKQDTIKEYSSSGGGLINVCDIDNDGDSDIVYAFSGSSKIIAWYENNTIGGGSKWTEHIINSELTTDIYPADIDKDGYPDLVVALGVTGSRRVAWLKNNQDGTFTENALTQTGIDNPYCLYAEDLNNDDHLDILVGGYKNANDSSAVFWFENNGDNTFATEKRIFAQYTTASDNYHFVDVLAADLNLDGKQDVVAVSRGDRIIFFENEGNGKFSADNTLTNNVKKPVNICVGNVDTSPDLEMLSASTEDSLIAFYHNNTAIITQDPQDIGPICETTTDAIFTIKAANAVYYKWYNSIEGPLVDGSYYSGVNTDTLHVKKLGVWLEGAEFYCVIRGPSPNNSRDTSETALLHDIDQLVTAEIENEDTLSYCEYTSLILNATDPTPRTGTWTSEEPEISFDNSTNKRVRVYLDYGTYHIYWTIDNKTCGISRDTIVINNHKRVTANAGEDIDVCADTVKLNGNTPPDYGYGYWKSTANSDLYYEDSTSPNTTVYNLSQSGYFTWYVNSGACGTSWDKIYVTIHTFQKADAGDDITLCSQNTTILHANKPNQDYSGTWSSSSSEVTFSSSHFQSASAYDIPHGTTTFTWTLYEPVCGSNSDEMTVTVYDKASIEQQPTDQTVTEGEKANLKIKVSGDVKSYQWYKGNNSLTDDTRISGTSIDSLVIDNTMQSDTGSYKCVFVDYCYNQSHDSQIAYLTVNAATTGIENLQQNGINVFPNPNNGVFQFINTSGEQIRKFSIVNMKGELIYEQEKPENKAIHVDLRTYPKGIYIINIEKGNKYLKYKIIVQ